jgi:hypothetical protein
MEDTKMATAGVSLHNRPGRGSVSFSNLTSPQTVTLDKGLWTVVLSMVDPAQPTCITITDAHGNVETLTHHATYPYMVGSYGCNPLTIDIVRPPAGAGVDFLALNPATMSEDGRSGGL